MSEALRFVKRLGAIYRVLIETPAGCWLINCNGPSPPFFEADLHRYERVPAPESWISEQINTPAQEARLQMIQPLLNCDKCISDKSQRYRMAAEAAQQYQTTTRRILRLYYRYLATGRLTQKRTQQASKSNQMIERAIRRYYFGAKRLSLRSAYEMMLLEDYVGPEGEMDSDAPTWSQFRHYYYGHSLHKDPQKIIAREGLTKYQRDHRPAWGTSSGWRPQPGSYQMDATQADIYLVSRQDRSIVVGRPYIYLAVDTATHLIAGAYVGFDCDETAVMACIEQAVMDKVAYCARYGIEITPEQWPSAGMPSEIITDQGREFFGPRMSELCRRYGLEVLTLPPFRPDQKGCVEKSIDLLQQRYKPMLRGLGVIEDDAQERWATDYRMQATLDLDDFTRIVIYAILYLNSGRLLDGKTPAERWLELSPRLMAVDPQELHIQILPRDTAKLTRKGLRINRMWYAPDDATGLMIGDSYTIAYDPADLRRIHIILADRICPCHAVEIGQPLSACEVDAVHEAAKKSRGVARAKETASSKPPHSLPILVRHSGQEYRKEITMTECYRYAIDTYEQMTEDEKAKISLELLYNAICYFHGDAKEIVQKLLHMDQMTLNQFADSLAATRQQVKQMHQAALAAMSALRQSVFASQDVEDILFYRIANCKRLVPLLHPCLCRQSGK